MSLLNLEGLRLYGIKPEVEDSILEPEDLVLEPFNTYRAEYMAIQIREENGIYRFGPMWAENKLVLSDQRKVWLQASDSALVITIGASHDIPFETHVRWDRTRHILDSFGTWAPRHRMWLTNYRSFDSELNFPTTFSYARASNAFSVVLGQIEQGIKIESEQSQLLSPPPTRSNLELTVAERVI